VTIRDEDGSPLLTYRSFASVVGVVGLMVSMIVAVTGISAVLFLLFESRIIPAVMALLLSAAFAVVIAMLVPPTNVTFYNSDSPVLHIAQESSVSFPIARFVVGSLQIAIIEMEMSAIDTHGAGAAMILLAEFIASKYAVPQPGAAESPG